ncbi:MAG: 50S ribosomal protein L32 [Candidatus Giovannonibacteria bacterium]|nr:MAG: 50S ribosomal protein L32 [Candidatus Giovannonibacteria bacterium]
MTVRMRHTPSHTKNRRSHHALAPAFLAKCPKCGAKALPHTVCGNCGFYKGKEAVDVLKKLSKKERKEKEKELAQKEHAG